MHRIIVFFAVFLTILACDPCRHINRCPGYIITDTVKETLVVTYQDTITYIEENESTLEAWFYCDSLNQVIMKELNVEKTKGVKTQSEFNKGVFKFRVMADSVEVLNRIITKIKGKEIILVNPVNKKMESDLKKTEKKLQIWKGVAIFGLAITLLIVLFVIIKILVR